MRETTTTKLVWLPGRDARRVSVQWRGVDWNYTLYWGDGTSEHVPQTDGARGHTYTTPGTYKVVAVSSVHSTYTASVPVTVRDWAKPPVPGSSLDGNVLTLTMPDVPDPVRWSVGWGDGTITTHEYGASVTHTYPWDFGTPEITVWDDPSARQVTFTGPEIGPDPTPPDLPVRGFIVWWLRTDTQGRAVFQMRGGGQQPGSTVTFYPRRSWADAVELTADANGELVHEFTHPISNTSPGFEDSWRSYSIHHTGGWEFLPVHPVKMRQHEPQVLYYVDDTNPLDVVLSVWPPQTGVHYVYFGDGFDARVNATEVPIKVPHNYAYQRPDRPITIFLPDGSKAQRSFDESVSPCAPCYWPDRPGQCHVGWNWTGDRNCPGACGGDSEAFAPVRVDTGGMYPPHVLHKPTNGDAAGVAYFYSGLSPGHYTFTYRTALADSRSYGVDIAKGARQIGPPDSGLMLLDEQDQSELTAWFGDVTEWDGGYRGRFTVHNPGEQEVPGWVVEFALAEPAVLREAWPRAEVTELAGGRWRISSPTPLPGCTSAVVTARVEPPGKTRKFPEAIQARAREGGDT